MNKNLSKISTEQLKKELHKRTWGRPVGWKLEWHDEFRGSSYYCFKTKKAALKVKEERGGELTRVYSKEYKFASRCR